MADSFAHLHVHTEYSMLDGAARVKALLTKAAALGQPAVASTDHGNPFSHYEMWQTAAQLREAGTDIKAILGMEAYVAPASRFHKKRVFWGSAGADRSAEGAKDVSGGGSFTHMTLLAGNAQGLRALFEISSRASIEGSYCAVGADKPRIDADLVAEALGNWPGAMLIGTTGCPSGAVQTRLRLGQYDKAVEEVGIWQDILGAENYFLELMDHGIDIERRAREDLLRLAADLDLPLLATNDSHYVERDEANMHDALLCVQTGKDLADTNRLKFDGDTYYLRSSQEMRELFAELPQACDNTLAIAERVTPDAYDEVLSYRDDLLPQFPVPEGHTEATYLRERIVVGLRAKYPDPDGPEGIRADAHERALGYEFPTIERMRYPGYMLMVEDTVRWAREQGIRVGPGRGSAAGSLVSYALDITTVPTLEHGLLFERFINPERVSPPDVDVDFEQGRRDEVFRYLTQRWGADKVCRIQTINTIKAKAAIKDACRVLGLSFSVGAKLTAAFPKAISGFEAPLACVEDETHPRHADADAFRAILAEDADARKAFDLACKIEGLIRSVGVHACGFVVSRYPLMGRIPLTWSEKDQQMVSGFPNATVLEPMGYLKMDCLGLDTMDVVQRTVDTVRTRHGRDVEADLVALDDPAAYEQLAGGHTVGLFQVGGGGIAKLLQQMRADRFEDISAALALYRPGPMGANAHTDYALRKTGRQRVTPIHPELEVPLRDVLGPTQGVIVYQEQVMAGAQEVAGYSLARADLLRKVMGKKKPEMLAKEFVPFREGMAAKGFSEEATKALWDIFVPFSAYAFNRCVSGDTVIRQLGRGSHHWVPTVEKVANRLHGRPDYDGTGCRYCHNDAGRRMKRPAVCTACESWRAKWRMQGGMNAAGRVGDRVLPVKVTDVFRQGVKPVWKMTLADGRSLTSTANHRHLTPHGWRQLGELVIGDEVCVMADGEWNVAAPRTDSPGSSNWARLHGYYVAERSHGKNGPFLHGRNAAFRAHTAVLERVCAHCGLREDQGARLERAHLDGDRLNNTAENLALLCGSCHKRHDYANGGRTKMWRKGRAIASSPIVSIEYVGEQMTYDVTVDSEDHSWVTNDGIVTHNSHTVSYGVITYATAWLKAHYPAEFMAALLTQAWNDTDKKAAYLAECRRMGIRVLSPDVNASEMAFTAVDGAIRFGLHAISGVGEGAAESIIRTRESKGAYTSFADWLAKSEATVCKKDLVAALIRAGAFDSLGHTRRGLLDIHADALAAVAKGKKVEATGQLGLLDLIATDEGGLGALAVEVPEHEWPEEAKLQLERDVLGLYISGHPLASYREVLAEYGKDSIAQLVAPPDPDTPAEPVVLDERGRAQRRQVQVAGILTEWEPKVSRAGNRYVRAVLEDLDAAIEVMVFQKTLEAIGDRLASLGPDVVVAVRGSLQGDEEGSPKIFANDVALLQATSAAQVKVPPTIITVQAPAFTPRLAAQLKELCLLHPGQSPLLVELVDPTKCSSTMVATPGRVARGNLHLVREACSHFGPNCLAA